LKQKLLNMAVSAGAFAPFRYANSGKALILMYHRFSREEERFSVSQNALAAHLKYLAKHYQVITLSEFLEIRKTQSSSLPAKLAVITIDDGYRDVFELALPVFKKFNLPATLFTVTDFLDGKIWIWTDKMRFLTTQTKLSEVNVFINNKEIKGNLTDADSRFIFAGKLNSELKKMPDEEKEREIIRLSNEFEVEIPTSPPTEFSPMTWTEAREIDKSLIKIESHTVTHPILPNVDEQRLEFELTASKTKLESEMTREMKIFCYPDGGHNEKVRNAAEKANYECAVTTELGFNDEKDDLFLLKRISAEPGMSHFVQNISGFESFKNSLRS
jgi:peptidoglycan/xylan/chitin deacetylase (PgdA/CDA1 family)